MSENENSCVHGVGVSQCHYCSGASVTPSMMFAAQIIDLTAERDTLKADYANVMDILRDKDRELFDAKAENATLRATIERARSLFTLDNEGHVTKISLALGDEVLATLSDAVLHLENTNERSRSEINEEGF